MGATLKDIARITGASLGAISKALNPDGTSNIRVSEEKKAKILKAALELSYRPNQAARQLAGKTSRIIGVLVSFEAPPIELERIALIERFAAEKGYHVIVSRLSLDSKLTELEEYLSSLSSRGVDGLIVIGHLLHRAEEEKAQHLYGAFPVVHLCDAGLLEKVGYGVSVDLDDGARQIVEHLREQGYKRIGLAMASERFESFFKEMKRCGIETDRALTWRLPVGSIVQQISSKQAIEIVDKLVLNKELDALVVENDYWAGRILRVFHERGIKAPEDTALVGYNNLEMSELFYPSLTTVDEGNEEIASALVASITALVEDKELPKNKHKFIAKPKLVKRETS